MKIKQVDDKLHFFCLGCRTMHVVSPAWGFNGNFEFPTLRDSVKVGGYHEDGRPVGCCHCFISNGQIQYLADCTHHLVGKTIELPDIG